MNNCYWFLCFSLLLVACNGPISPIDFAAHIQDPSNGLKIFQEFESCEIKLQYKPTPYMALQEWRKPRLDVTTYNQLSQKYERAHHFNLRIAFKGMETNLTKHHVSTNQAQQELLYYLSYPFQQDIYLVEGRDTLRCDMYHFERSYDLSPFKSLVIAFENKPENKYLDKELLIHSPLFNYEPISVIIQADDLNNLPNLKLEQ